MWSLLKHIWSLLMLMWSLLKLMEIVLCGASGGGGLENLKWSHRL